MKIKKVNDLFKGIKGLKEIFIGKLVLTLLNLLLSFISATLLGDILDSALNRETRAIVYNSLFLIIAVLIILFCNYFIGIRFDKKRKICEHVYKINFCNNIFTQKLSHLIGFSTAEIRQRLDVDGIKLFNLYYEAFPTFIINVTSIGFYTYFILEKDVLFAIIALIIASLQLVPHLMMRAYNEKYYSKTQEIEEKIISFLIESYKSLALLKSYNLISTTMKRLKDLHKSSFKICFKGEVVNQVDCILEEFLTMLSNYGTYILLGFFIMKGKIDFPVAAELVIICTSLYKVSVDTFLFFNEFFESKISRERISQLIMSSTNNQVFIHEPITNSKDVAIEFSNVSFKYNESPVLKDISFKIYKDKVNIIHGRNGSGKSTIIKLIMKIYENYKGDIFLHGENLKDISDNKLYNTLSLLSQVDWDLYITPKEIIEEYKNQYSLNANEIENILMDMNLNEDILSKHSFAELSGGERKKIHTFLSLCRKFDIVILDEPTNNMDEKSINNFINMLENMNKTVVLISHNPIISKNLKNTVKISLG